MRKPKDRDFIRTVEGMFFCVTGYLHPPDKYTAYLKYSPVAQGKWQDTETAYRRELEYYHVRNVAATIRFLEHHYPQYVHHCPVRNITFSMVPQEYVKKYYVPEERLKEILTAPSDSLEEEICAFVSELLAVSAVEKDALGITGSTLIGIHNPRFSDIDLLVYGLDNARRVRAALKEKRSPAIRPVAGHEMEAWCASVAARFPLSIEEARHIAGRRWNYGYFGERYFSIHPTRTDDEIKENYGDRVYRGEGEARVRAVVTDAGESLFMPAVYRVDDVEVLSGGASLPLLREIVSYEGLYRDVVDSGQRVEARGKLESVNGQYYRLVIGTTMLGGAGYIKPVTEQE